MSHFTTIKTQIKDLAALRAACTELALTLVPNATARSYVNNTTRGDYVIQLRGPYDIALNRHPNGSYGLTADLWQGHVGRDSWSWMASLLSWSNNCTVRWLPLANTGRMYAAIHNPPHLSRRFIYARPCPISQPNFK